MQELGKFNHKINIPNGLEKYMSISINNKLSFIDSFQFLSSSLGSLGKNLGKDDFKCLSQEFDNNVLDLVKQKAFYHYEYVTDLKSLKNNYQAKKSFVICYQVKKLVTKNRIMFLRFGTNLKWKLWKIITICI